MSSRTDSIPDAWPALMNIEQLCAYLGGISDATRKKICPVAPLDLGANVVLFRKSDVDAWKDTLPHRQPLRATSDDAQDQPPALEALQPANDRRQTAIERARARAQGGSAWRRSATSSASAKAG